MKTPFPYQDEVDAEIDQFEDRVLLSLDQGLGKTYVALRRLRYRWMRPALVICQANVKYAWEAEAAEQGYTVAVCEGQTPPREKGLFPTAQVIIINYDVLRFWVDYLLGLDIKTVIIDECQNLANPDRKRTKAAKAVAAGRPFLLALSGTPLLNRPRELYPILNMLCPQHYNSRHSYAEAYCNLRLTARGWDWDGACNLDQLHAELKTRCMIRRRKADVLKDLPPKIRQIVPCELSDYAEYREATTNFMNWLRKNMGHRVRRAAKVEKLAQVGYQLRLIARLKFRAVVEWANRMLEETDEKIILSAVHKKMIEALARRVNSPSIRIDGSVTGRARQYAIDQFQNDDVTRICLCSIAGTTGITLTRASIIGVTEFFWRPGDHNQLEDRPHRIGQLNTVWVNYLVAVGTLEERLCKLLQKKQQTISAVLDGGPAPGDLNLYDELLQHLESELGGDYDKGKR